MEEDEDDEEKEDYLYFEEASWLLRKLEADKPQLASIQDEKNSRHIYELIDHQIHSLEKKPEKIRKPRNTCLFVNHGIMPLTLFLNSNLWNPAFIHVHPWNKPK